MKPGREERETRLQGMPRNDLVQLFTSLYRKLASYDPAVSAIIVREKRDQELIRFILDQEYPDQA